MNRTSVGMAVGLLFVVATQAQATLAPNAATPENELIDSSTGLAWIKVSTLAQGQSLGYRLATADEAAHLDYASATASGGIYQLGVDSSSNGVIKQSDYRSLSYAVSYGRVAGANGQTLLAGYSYDSFTSTYVPPSYTDPVTGTVVYPPSRTSTSYYNHLLVGAVSLFADQGTFPSVYSNVLNADGSLGRACRNGNDCYPGNTLWSGSTSTSIGYFMVKATVPEASSGLMLGLGLAMLGWMRGRKALANG